MSSANKGPDAIDIDVDDDEEAQDEKVQEDDDNEEDEDEEQEALDIPMTRNPTNTFDPSNLNQQRPGPALNTAPPPTHVNAPLLVSPRDKFGPEPSHFDVLNANDYQFQLPIDNTDYRSFVVESASKLGKVPGCRDEDSAEENNLKQKLVPLPFLRHASVASITSLGSIASSFSGSSASLLSLSPSELADELEASLRLSGSQSPAPRVGNEVAAQVSQLEIAPPQITPSVEPALAAPGTGTGTPRRNEQPDITPGASTAIPTTTANSATPANPVVTPRRNLQQRV